MRKNQLLSSQVRAVEGEIHGFPILMFVDRVQTGTTNNKPNFSNSGVIVVGLHKIFPQLVLDSNQNDKFFLKTRSANIDASQKINLEGNFSHFFDFYAPKGINANTLTVLAPNFMQLLIDSSATFDVEVFGDRLYIMTHDPLFTATIMNEALQALDAQLQYMHRLEQSWTYRPKRLPFDTLVPAGSTVHELYTVKVGNRRVGLTLILVISFIFIVIAISVLGSST